MKRARSMAWNLEEEIEHRLTYEARRDAWAQAHGLRYVAHPCLSKLLGHRCKAEGGLDYWGPGCALHRPPHPDHDTMWRAAESRSPSVYLNQPYDWSDQDARETAAVCEDHGLAWVADPAAAWHYPGHVAGIVIWNPGRYDYQPGPIAAPPPLDAGRVTRRAQRERTERSKGHRAYDTLCRALDALFYPGAEPGKPVSDRFGSEEQGQATPHAALSDEDLEAIEARCRAARPGPWHWTHDLVNEYVRSRRSGKHWRERYIYLLQGRGQRFQDSSDARVLGLEWNLIKGDTFCGSPRPADAAFIAAARSDVPRLLAEVRRLREELRRRGEDRR